MKTKICFVASSGGHLEEISCLNSIENKYDSFLITERVKGSEKNKFTEKKYFFPQINRKEIFFIFKFLYLFIVALKILILEKPEYIISTGALCTYPVCFIGKLLRIKIIYIESFARSETLSLTGKLMKSIADIFIVQWSELLEIVPNSVYGGGIF